MKRDDLTRSLSSRPVVYWIVLVVTVAATWFGCFFFAALLTVPITMEKDKDGRLVSKGEFAPYAVGIAVGSIMAGVAAWRLRRRYSGRRLPGDDLPFSTSIGAPDRNETGVQTRSGYDGPSSDQIKP
jgi:hypothetical protein